MRYIRTITLFAAVLVLVMVATTVGQDISKLHFPKLHELKVPHVEKVTLDNGLRLYLVEDHSLPLFRMSVRVNAGSYLEEPEQVGLVSILGTTLRTGGTEKWSGDELDELLESIGASLETGGDLATCNASANFISDYTALAIEVLAEVLRRPTFDQDKIDLAKIQERSAISRRNDEPLPLAIREFKKVIYGPQSVFARQAEYATVNAVTRDDLIAYHDRYFVPNNVQVAIWGDFDKNKVVDLMKQYFSDWSGGTEEVPPLPEVDYTYEPVVYHAEKTDVTQSNILMGHIGGRQTDDDYPDMIVMNNILGGGLGGRMFNRVRSKEGLAYSASASYTANISYPGFFYAYVGTKSGTTVEAIRKAMEVVGSMLTEPPTDEEMKRGKEGYLNSFVFNFDSKAEVVNRLMAYDKYNLPEDFLQKQKEKIEQVQKEDVVAAAQANLHPEEMRVMVVGKAEDFDEPLENLGYGQVVQVDISIPSAEAEREIEVTPENIEKGLAILNKAAEALGGQAAFDAIKSVAIKGTQTFVMQGQEIPVPFTQYTVYPDRQATTAMVFGQKIYDVYAGTAGWKTDQSMTVVAKTEDDLLDDQRAMARDLILVFQELDNPTYQPVFSGTGNVNGVDVVFVTLLDKDGEQICRFGFNPSTYQVVCNYYHSKTMVGEGTVEEFYTDFTQTDGVTLPSASTESLEGQQFGSVKMSEMTVNGVIPEDAFAQPQ
jgi:zinc protease